MEGNFDEVTPPEYRGMDMNDKEGARWWAYECWEMEQLSTGLPPEEWDPFVWNDVHCSSVKENKPVIKNTKKPKVETGRERWERLEEKKERNEIKRVFRMVRKLQREGKIRRIDSYFKNK